MKTSFEVDGTCVHLGTGDRELSVAISIRQSGEPVGDEDIWMSLAEAQTLADLLQGTILVAKESVD